MFKLYIVVLLSIFLFIGCNTPVYSHVADKAAPSVRIPAAGYEFLGEVEFSTGYMYKATEVGGLSGIAYSPETDCYYAVSDDRSQINPARFYTLKIDLSDGRLGSGDIVFTGVTTLRDEKDGLFRKGRIDPEGIAITTEGVVYISSEGDAKKHIAPFVNGFDANGRQLRQLSVPQKYLPAAHSGVRSNLALESLTITPDERFLYTAVENALLQDGPKADLGQQSLSRIVKYDLKKGTAIAEYIYKVEAVAQAPQLFFGSRSNGLVELIAVDNDGTLLALERGFSTGRGVTAKLYRVRTQGASNVRAEYSLVPKEKDAPPTKHTPVSKEEILNFADLPPGVDNLEGMTFGPRLPDGRRTLIVVSDNNFNSVQKTQFIVLALDF